MTEKNERLQILEMIESGVITAAEGARLLQALDTDDRLEESLEGETDFAAGHDGNSAGPGTSSQTEEDEFGSLNNEVIENVFEPKFLDFKLVGGAEVLQE